MALHPNKHRAQQQRQHHRNSLFFLDFLYCAEEERWDDGEEEEGGGEDEPDLQLEEPVFDDNGGGGGTNDFSSSSSLLEETHLLVWEDDELGCLFSKERENLKSSEALEGLVERDGVLSVARREAVEWVLKVNAHYGFSTLTALLAINYLDRILSGPHFQREKPWMVQLLAVTCISLAAKVEEIRVPLLLDLQVEDSKYIFESKTIQRMELLVLTALQWKMHPVTPVSFLGLITRRLGLKNHIQWEFFRRCERILLSLVADSRSVGFLPSVMAISTMVSVVEEMGNSNPSVFQDRLLNALKITKGRVKECCILIMETRGDKRRGSGKRKQEERSEGEEEEAEGEEEEEEEAGRSPNGVIEASFSCDSSNDSWGVGTVSAGGAAACPSKRSRAGDQLPP